VCVCVCVCVLSVALKMLCFRREEEDTNSDISVVVPEGLQRLAESMKRVGSRRLTVAGKATLLSTSYGDHLFGSGWDAWLPERMKKLALDRK